MKRFLIKTLLLALPILAVIGYYSGCIQPRLRTNGTGSGDLGRLGLLFFPADYTLPKPDFQQFAHNVEYTDSIPSDSCVWVIGDSFSQPDKTSKYTDFLAQYATFPVYNFSTGWLHGNPFNSFLYLSKTQPLPSVVIVESVERALLSRLCNAQIALAADSLMTQKYLDTVPPTAQRFSDKTLLEQTQEFVKKRVGIDNPVKTAELRTPMFTCRGHENGLYFINEDLQKFDAERMDLAVRKLDSLFAYAQEVGVHLYVVVAEDKYDLYQPYIVDNPYPQSVNLDTLAERIYSPYFINSKDTLALIAAQGVRDIFFCDDTHWSQVGGKAVAEQVAIRIMQTEGDSTLFVLP